MDKLVLMEHLSGILSNEYTMYIIHVNISRHLINVVLVVAIALVALKNEEFEANGGQHFGKVNMVKRRCYMNVG